MLNYIWALMILIGVVYGAITGKMADVTNAALDSAGDAVSLCITMIGVMALWVGLMEIAQKSGLIAKMTRGIQPFITFLFPRIPQGHIAREYIHESDRKYPGTWLGVYAGGTQGDGGARGSGKRAGKRGVSGEGQDEPGAGRSETAGIGKR